MLTVIGCGNGSRCDDGAGVYVAQALLAHLRAHPRADVRVFDAGTGGVDVILQARGARRLILVDAARTGAPAGEIFRVPGAELATDHVPGLSLHDFRWDHALAVGRRMFRDDFPREVTVYLIEAQELGFGLELSAPVRAAADRVIGELRDVIDGYAG
jgi:hydrogenase maturation protease